jgi:hypothetical protein
VTSAPQPELRDAHPERGVRNSQPEGIGRVVVLDGLCAWNNLGRNVVFATPQLEPLAIFGETQFPDDDEQSQFDLDIHAILDVPNTGIVVVLNHLGLLRAFSLSEISRQGPVRRVDPVWSRAFADDAERVVMLGDRVVASRPREQRAAGVLVSEPITATASGARLSAEVALEAWGPVTALESLSVDGHDALAVGGDGRVSLVVTANGKVGPARWEVDVGFQPAALVHDGGLLWAAGSERSLVGIDDYDWEQLRGGGFVGLDVADGTPVVTGRFPDDVAWGNGGTAVVRVTDVLCAVGRTGGLHAFDARDGHLLPGTAPFASHSLGIAHAAAVGATVVFGFNRAGYQLHSIAASAIGAYGA